MSPLYDKFLMQATGLAIAVIADKNKARCGKLISASVRSAVIMELQGLLRPHEGECDSTFTQYEPCTRCNMTNRVQKLIAMHHSVDSGSYGVCYRCMEGIGEELTVGLDRNLLQGGVCAECGTKSHRPLHCVRARKALV